MKTLFAILFAASFSVRPLPDADGPLEPSIQNEVDHAVDLAEAWLKNHACTNALPRGDFFHTNALKRAEVAVKLVSEQKAEGWWGWSTNSAPTRLALEILKGL